MPITTIPATAEGMPRFDRRAIMAAAWERWRDYRRRYAPWQIARGVMGSSFAECLRGQWRIAKAARAQEIEERTIAALSGTPTGERIATLKAAIDRADYASFRYSAREIRADLSRELQTTIAAARQGAGHNAAMSA